MKSRVNISHPSTLKVRLNGGPSAFAMFDKQGREIYRRHLPPGTSEARVNIPRPGEYFTGPEAMVTDILPLEKSIPKFTLPEPERARFKPWKIEYNEELGQGTPARIYTDTGRIEIGPRFAAFPPQIRLFILLHELGHFFYKTEWKTDLFALYHYMNLGYNTSQAFYSLSKVLNPDAPHNLARMMRLFNAIKTGK